MATPVEIWGYGLMDARGMHQIDIEARDLEDGQSVFVGNLQVHHISIDDAGVLSIALDRPISTVQITESESGIWLAPKKWDEIAWDLPRPDPNGRPPQQQQQQQQQPTGTVTGRIASSQPPPMWNPLPPSTHVHNPDKCVQCSRCSGCTISHSAGCDAVLSRQSAGIIGRSVLDNVLREVADAADKRAAVDTILAHPEVMKKIAELARAKLPHAISQVKDGGITLFGIPVKLDPSMQPGAITVKYDKGEHI